MHGVDVPYDPVMKRVGSINQMAMDRKIASEEATNYNEAVIVQEDLPITHDPELLR